MNLPDSIRVFPVNLRQKRGNEADLISLRCNGENYISSYCVMRQKRFFSVSVHLMHKCVCVHEYVPMRPRVCVHQYVCVCVCVCVCVWIITLRQNVLVHLFNIYIYIYIQTHTHTHIYIYNINRERQRDRDLKSPIALTSAAASKHTMSCSLTCFSK